MLLGSSTIEPITGRLSEPIPFGEAQRIEEVTYESSALPLSYSATAAKFIERDPERQPSAFQHITIEQRITSAAHVCPRARLTPARPGHVAKHLSSRFELKLVSSMG